MSLVGEEIFESTLQSNLSVANTLQVPSVSHVKIGATTVEEPSNGCNMP